MQGQGQKLQCLDYRSLVLIARPVALINCHFGWCMLCPPSQTGVLVLTSWLLLFDLPSLHTFLPCPFSLQSVFSGWPLHRADSCVGWRHCAGTEVGKQREEHTGVIWAKPNKIKPFFPFSFFLSFCFLFLAGWQIVELYDLPVGLFVSEFLLRQFVQAMDSSSLLWLCSIWSLVSETILKCLCLLTVPGWKYWGTTNQHPAALGAEWS